MIAAAPDPDFTTLAARLAGKAERLIEARMSGRTLSLTRRWRSAALLWPLFTKG